MADGDATIKLFVYYGKNVKPAVVITTLQPRLYSFKDFQAEIVVAVKPLCFNHIDILAGDIFVYPALNGKPPRPTGDGIDGNTVNLAPEDGINKCVLLNLGESE